MNRVLPAMVRRILASFALAGTLVSLALPALVNPLSHPEDCHHAFAANTSSMSEASPSDCHQPGGTACTTIACCTGGLACSPLTSFVLAPIVRLTPPPGPPVVDGLLTVGPPTPPPNS
jgi:hypothetical protein